MTRLSRSSNLLLWTVQILLALVFVFAGGMKLVLPRSALEQGPILLPVAFLRFVGIAECMGGLGLVLPGMFRTARFLTPLAAVGLVLIMAGATTVTALAGNPAAALFPALAGGLASAVCLGRGGAALPWGRDTASSQR